MYVFCYGIAGHADSITTHTYLQIHTKCGDNILLSREHLLPVGCHGNLKASRDVVPGDVVLLMCDGDVKESRVTRVETVIKKGAYCPHTTGNFY